MFTTSVRAQQRGHEIIVNLGASSGYGYPSGLTSTENGGIPTLNLHFEKSAGRYFSIGPYIAYTYSFYKFDNPQTGYKDVWKGWDVGIRGSFHLGPLI